MTSRITLFAALCATAAQLPAQTAAPPPAVAAKEQLVTVALDTSAGRILIALDKGRAPATTANFLHYVDSGKLNGEGFYRAMPLSKGGLIQGGVTSDARKPPRRSRTSRRARPASAMSPEPSRWPAPAPAPPGPTFSS